MTRDETIQFLKRILGFYPRFQMEEQTVDAYYSKLKVLDYEDAVKRLEAWVDQDEYGKPPTLARILHGDIRVNDADIDWNYRATMKLKPLDRDTFMDQNRYLWAYPDPENHRNPYEQLQGCIEDLKVRTPMPQEKFNWK